MTFYRNEAEAMDAHIILPLRGDNADSRAVSALI